MTTWNPDQYLAYAGPRTRAALDLIDRIPPVEPGAAVTVYDLGCGTGNITASIAQRWPNARVIGIDSSTDMLNKARKDHKRGSATSIDWRLDDIQAWTAKPVADIIYSNAALHWLNQHEQLFPHLLTQLRPGGILAVQMPLSWHAPSHQIMRDVLENGGDNGAPLGDDALRRRYSTPPVMQPEAYHALIAPHVDRVDIWKTEYLHVLHGDNAVFDWVAGTGLRPILQNLQGDDRERFLFDYRARVRAAYPQNQRGETLYLFPRLFLVATKRKAVTSKSPANKRESNIG